MNSDVRQALAYCRQLTRRQAKNFYFAFLFLPSDKRAAVYSVYAFCRHSDDIADNPAPLQYKRDQLKHWRDELESCYNGNPTGLITLALRHTIRKYPIPQRYFEELLRGVEMDLTVQRYASFDDLKLYCYRVASAVGLACLEIFGYRHNGVRTYARNLGIALQLTNILRDVREDAERGRIYIPQEDLLAYGVTEKDVLRHRYSESFAALMRFQQERIMSHYRRAAGALQPGDRTGLMAPEIMAAIYRATLHKMRRRNFNVFYSRTRLSSLRKICIGLGVFLSLCFRDGWYGQSLSPTPGGNGRNSLIDDSRPSGSMQAAMLYGPSQVAVESLPIPTIGPGEVLVQVAAATTCGTDLKVYLQGRHARMLTPPSVFGHEFSGRVAAVGSKVRGFEPGMRVVSNNSAPCERCFYCGRGQPNLCDDLVFINGGYAEYIAVPERIVQTNLLVLPDDLPFPVACITEPLACVLHCLDLAAFSHGDTVAVNGDGPSGLMLAAMAKRRGARVILCGRAPQRLQVARQFGIELLVNYAEAADQAEAVRALTDNKRGVDVAIEAVGRPDVWETTTAMVRKGGRAVFYGGPPGGTSMLVDAPSLHYDQITLQGVFHNTPAHVAQALEILADRTVPWDALLSTTLPLTRLPHAFSLMMNRQALKVVILPASQPV